VWCKEIPLLDEASGSNDRDMDRAVYVVEHFADVNAAERRARELLAQGLDQFGSVRIAEQERRVNEDIREHEGRTAWEWVDVAEAHFDDHESPAAVKLELVRH
jgi:hypothetical protein